MVQQAIYLHQDPPLEKGVPVGRGILRCLINIKFLKSPCPPFFKGGLTHINPTIYMDSLTSNITRPIAC